jgi:hypothetical protein
MGEAVSHRPRYSDHNCKGVAGSLVPLRPLGKEKIVRTVRFDHLRTALLAVAAAGLLVAVGLVVLYAQPAEANYPGKPGKIAYSGWDGNDLEIYTINPNGGSNLKVTNDQSGNEGPTYSPNGTKIAYSGVGGNDWDIYTISINGGDRKNVTNNNADDIQPSYSPSGKSIAYVYDPGAGDAEIYYIKPDGGGRTPVTANNRDDLYPYWGSK